MISIVNIERLEEGSAVKRDKLNKELQNGRLAMLAMMELLTHDVARPAGEGLFVLHHFWYDDDGDGYGHGGDNDDGGDDQDHGGWCWCSSYNR